MCVFLGSGSLLFCVSVSVWHKLDCLGHMPAKVFAIAFLSAENHYAYSSWAAGDGGILWSFCVFFSGFRLCLKCARDTYMHCTGIDHKFSTLYLVAAKW